MVLVDKKVTIQDLVEMSKKMHEALVKVVVDIDRQIMVADAKFHSDQEAFLLQNGSKQENLWGINIRPDKAGLEGFIEFDSMINIRPAIGNRGRGVYNVEIQKKIIKIVDKLVVI